MLERAGARIGRFDPELKGHFDPHNQSFMMLGTMILWFGWYGFNPGSTQALANGQGLVAARIAINTTMSAACGTIAGLFCAKIFMKQWHLPTALNGCLAGLVAITGGCSVLQPWAACIAGITAALIYYWSSWWLVNKLKIDDPLEATNVHFFCGAWGLILVGLFAYPDSIERAYNRPPGSVVDYGLLVGGGGKQLAMQLIGIVSIGAWTVVFSGASWLLMRAFKIIRISEAAEKDLLSHAVELERIQKGSRALKAVAVGGEGTEVRQMAPKQFAGATREAGKETIVVIQDSDDEESGPMTPKTPAKVTANSSTARITYIEDSSSASVSESSGARRRFTTDGRKASANLAAKVAAPQSDSSTSDDDEDSTEDLPLAKPTSAKASNKPVSKSSSSKKPRKKTSSKRTAPSSSSTSTKPQSARNVVHIPDSSDDTTTSE